MRLQSRELIQTTVGNQCRIYRNKCLDLTLQGMSDKVGINMKTLSGFENGRSGNIYIFYVYYALLSEQSKVNLLDDILERVE